MLLPQGRVKKDDEEPVLEPFEVYVEWFFELNSCRSTMSLAPIPFTDIHKFAKIYEYDDFEEFHYLMRRLDNHYLSVKGKKNNAS